MPILISSNYQVMATSFAFSDARIKKVTSVLFCCSLFFFSLIQSSNISHSLITPVANYGFAMADIDFKWSVKEALDLLFWKEKDLIIECELQPPKGCD